VSDGALLAELKWKIASMVDENERPRLTGKHANRKAKSKLPTHRYPTRFSEAQEDLVLELAPSEIEAMERRITVLEGEARGLLDALSASLTGFREAQAKVNLVTLREMSRVRALYTDLIEPRLNAHSHEVAKLIANYNMLHALASSLLGPSLMTKISSTTPRLRPYARPPIRSSPLKIEIPPMRNLEQAL